MRKSFVIFLALTLAIPLTFATAFAGNGAPSGAHYNLNLLGKDKCPGDDLIGANRHTIMVLLNFSDPDANNTLGDNLGNYATLDKKNKIFLAPGTDFQVTDGNACDGNGARFTLPADIATAWTIWVRELGKPGGTGDIALCGVDDSGTPVDTADDEVVCSTDQVLLMRNKGKSTFRNVTRQLTTIDYQILAGYDGIDNPIYVQDSATLFDADFYQYLWDYDNNGLRLIQLRFYPAPVQ